VEAYCQSASSTTGSRARLAMRCHASRPGACGSAARHWPSGRRAFSDIASRPFKLARLASICAELLD
jgi:hypothetical protein